MTTRSEAIEEAVQAIGIELELFQCRIAVTTRAYHEFDIEALTFEDAVDKAAAIDIHRTYGHVFSDYGIEGDEIILVEANDDEGNDTVEVDMRGDGEPFSWTACDIVKDLAKADRTDMVVINAIIDAAIAACKKD